MNFYDVMELLKREGFDSGDAQQTLEYVFGTAAGQTCQYCPPMAITGHH